MLYDTTQLKKKCLDNKITCNLEILSKAKIIEITNHIMKIKLFSAEFLQKAKNLVKEKSAG